MLDVLERCFPGRQSAWAPKLAKLIPSYGKSLATNAAAARASLTRTAAVLGIR
jgi:malate dehydrogenase (quinone)